MAAAACHTVTVLLGPVPSKQKHGAQQQLALVVVVCLCCRCCYRCRRLLYPGVACRVCMASEWPKSFLVVANVDSNQVLYDDSNYGSICKVAAPGTEIKGAGTESDIALSIYTGTSQAAPHVSGMAVLLFNAFPGASTERVYDCIINTATRPVKPNPKVEEERPVGGGIADLKAAYECMNDQPTCPTYGLPACVIAESGKCHDPVSA